MPRKPSPHLTPVAVEATAAAFLAAFKALPGKVKGRFVELLDDYEDELEWQELEAAKTANPDDFDSKNSITIQEYVEQRKHQTGKTGQRTDRQSQAA